MRSALWGHAAMALFAMAISVSFSLGDRAAPHIDPAALTAARFLIAAAVLGAIAWPKMRREHLAAPWRYPVLGGLLGLYFILMFVALADTGKVDVFEFGSGKRVRTLDVPGVSVVSNYWRQ